MWIMTFPRSRLAYVLVLVSFGWIWALITFLVSCPVGRLSHGSHPSTTSNQWGSHPHSNCTMISCLLTSESCEVVPSIVTVPPVVHIFHKVFSNITIPRLRESVPASIQAIHQLPVRLVNFQRLKAAWDEARMLNHNSTSPRNFPVTLLFACFWWLCS